MSVFVLKWCFEFEFVFEFVKGDFLGMLFLVENFVLLFFIHKDMGLIIAHSGFKSQEMDVENKVAEAVL